MRLSQLLLLCIYAILNALKTLLLRIGMKRKYLLNGLLIVFAATFVFSAYKLYDIYSKYKQGRDEYTSIFEYAYIPPDSVQITDAADATDGDKAEPKAVPLVDYRALKEINPDYIGWIDIPGSSISYPIVVGGADNYYLKHTFKKAYNEAGCIFLDYRTSDFNSRHVVIYGHRMRDGSMFAGLGKYLDPVFYADNKEIHIYTNTELLVYEIFSVREVYTDDSCYNLNFADNKAFGTWLGQMKSSSLYETELNPVDSKGIITLSTCVTGNREKRCVVQAQLVRKHRLFSLS